MVTEIGLEFASPPATLWLESTRLEQAIRLSEQFGNSDRRWQVYQQALALFSFEDWLGQRAPSLPLQVQQCSVYQPEVANVMDAVCHLQVGPFQVVLVPNAAWSEAMMVPRAVVELSEFAAHFVVAIGLSESADMAMIQGFLRYDELVRDGADLQSDRDWLVPFPIDGLHRNPNQLLLELQCLEPSALPLPRVLTDHSQTLSSNQTEVAALLPQLHGRALWRQLSWTQATTLLTSSALLERWYQRSAQPFQFWMSYGVDRLAQEIVNVGQWAQQQLVCGEQPANWTLLPANAPLRRGRGSAEPLTDLLQDIQQRTGLHIPLTAGCGYKEWTPTELQRLSTTPATPEDSKQPAALRLYAVSWPVPEVENGWTLLLVLGGIPGGDPPYGSTLWVSDQQQVLVEAELSCEDEAAYLYVQVEGTYGERFVAMVMPAMGTQPIICGFDFDVEDANA